MVLDPTGFLLHSSYNSDREHDILRPPSQRFYAVLEGICFFVCGLRLYFWEGENRCLMLFLLCEDIHKFQNVLNPNGNLWSKRINFNLQIY